MSTVKFELSESRDFVNLNFTELVQQLVHSKIQVDNIYRFCQLELYSGDSVNLNFTELVQKMVHNKVQVDKIYRFWQLELYWLDPKIGPP